VRLLELTPSRTSGLTGRGIYASSHPARSTTLAHHKFRNAEKRLAVNPSLTRKTKQNENMKHTHTQGEWTKLGCTVYAGETMIAGTYCEGNRSLHPIVFEKDIVPDSMGTHGDGWDEAGANARLISAAPELLEALQMLMPQEPREADSYDRAMWENARAAIAKAIGKEDA